MIVGHQTGIGVLEDLKRLSRTIEEALPDLITAISAFVVVAIGLTHGPIETHTDIPICSSPMVVQTAQLHKSTYCGNESCTEAEGALPGNSSAPGSRSP